jgi:GntR family transcriptional regulator, transcriptional repressor for pyruvate dehydrogenase complex
MKHAFAPLERQSLSDRLARQIRGSIQSGDFRRGDRLPPIMEMARRFGVGHPTIREALKKLEAMGVVDIRHGSGVFVSRSEEVLVLASPDYSGLLTKKLLIDLIRARKPLEMQSVSDAVHNATAEHLNEMRRLLTTARESLDDDDRLNLANMGFHQQIARGSGNVVLAQLLSVLHELFRDEQRLILGIGASRTRDHEEHLQILDAVEQRDEKLAVERMRAHLEGVQDLIMRWDPEANPVR